MDKLKFLSGDELVARGITKIDGTLPEIGSKDVFPNGSWLEQKQIQSALEARKHMISVERIEKSGVLSHAEWREDLMLAEVTQKIGGHWQYLGHNVGKKLFLRPEEALYLMEVNCLLLKHDGVKVSLQQAYSLLLRSKILLLQYKVYASLSRIGYKVYRHEENRSTFNKKKVNLISSPEKEVEKITETECDDNEPSKTSMEVDDTKRDRIDEAGEVMEVSIIEDSTIEDKSCDKAKEAIIEDEVVAVKSTEEKTDIKMETDVVNAGSSTEECKQKQPVEVNKTTDLTLSRYNPEIKDHTTENFIAEDTDIHTDSNCKDNTNTQPEITSDRNTSFRNTSNEFRNQEESVNKESLNSEGISKRPSFYLNKLRTLENRQLKLHDSKSIDKCFEKVPDLLQKQIVTVTVPEEQYIPRNVFLNNIHYVLNLDNIRSKSRSTRPESSESRPFSANEEVNGDHIRRIRDANASRQSNNWTSTSPRFPTEPNQFYRQRLQQFWRPNTNYVPYNFYIQRPFTVNMNYNRFRYFGRPPPLLLSMYRTPSTQPINENRQNFPDNIRKRKRNETKKIHFEAIKNLASRLKQIAQSRAPQTSHFTNLQTLVQTFNARYQMQLRLTENFEIVNDERIVETISLDDDEETNAKRAKADSNDTQKENLDKLKEMALKLKALEDEGKANPRHKRALTKVVNKFNKSYNAEIYVNNDLEIIDKRCITLDSSSDSDCVVEEAPKPLQGKKLKNPFNILKRLSEKQNSSSSSNASKEGTSSEEKDNKYSKVIKAIFSKHWLPSEDDFGRAEVPPKHLMVAYLIESKRDEYLYEFMKSEGYEFENWLDLKVAFLRSVKETTALLESEFKEQESKEENSITSIIGNDDPTDMPSVLKKLSIIKCNNEVDNESSLSLDFDVYNRDVKNFRKSNRPKPHFRVVCICETSSPPSGRDIATLHSKYDGDVAIVFAVVGGGAINYLQINPFDLPIHIPSHDLG